MAPFTAHDLRRTGRVFLVKLGVKVDLAERVLNHARERTEATYDLHEYVDEKRAAPERWSSHLAHLRDAAMLFKAPNPPFQTELGPAGSRETS